MFFDEFDAVGKERGDENETGEIKRVVTSLLMQIDALPSYTVVIAALNHPELLDRATWRRFQFRMELPAPTPAQLKRYLEAFANNMGEPPGMVPRTIANALGEVSFAEAEEFCLGVRRRHALSMGEGSLKSIVREQLKRWQSRAPRPDSG